MAGGSLLSAAGGGAEDKTAADGSSAVATACVSGWDSDEMESCSGMEFAVETGWIECIPGRSAKMGRGEGRDGAHSGEAEGAGAYTVRGIGRERICDAT